MRLLLLLACAHPAGPPAAPTHPPEGAAHAASGDLSPTDVPAARAALWADYAASAQKVPLDAEGVARGVLASGAHEMRYTAERIGARPEAGWPVYIALHGGGGAPAEVNDRQWEHMQVYYRDSVRAGIYVAPRGISDTWDLHFVDAAYPLYDALIEGLIAAGADPDRVYLLGFSAGGDGVYQIAPRMADRFAAVSMSAGHPNGIPADDLHQLPMLLQAGERDEAYDRHAETARYGLALDALAAERGGYDHDTWLHLDGEHNRPWRGNDPSGARYPVIADLQSWLDGEGREAVEVDSDAVRWLDARSRDPWPRSVIYLPKLQAGAREGARGHSRYWLDVGADPSAWGERLEARIDGQTIAVEYDGAWLRILLREEMVDLSQPLAIQIGDQTIPAQPAPDLSLLSETMADRGDPRFSFPAAITLARRDAGWALVE